MKKQWIPIWIAVFLCAGAALASVLTNDPGQGLFSSTFDDY